MIALHRQLLNILILSHKSGIHGKILNLLKSNSIMDSSDLAFALMNTYSKSVAAPGILTAAILRQLSQAGRITAIDISSRMIEIAQKKLDDSRVQWICDSIEHMTTYESVFDRVICYSVWPHLKNPEKVVRLIQNMLKPGAKLHIWHLNSREAINNIHAKASEVISSHMLVPASQTAALLEQSGFIVEETLDDDSGYLVSARRVWS